MAKLTVKARGSAQGKQKVFFSAHAEDHARFWESVSEELLEKQNCAVYCLEDPSAVRDADFLKDLGEMQLLVIPVTARFLYQKNDAREVDFAFAIEHHIPVLPLMQESGLEADFNRICGDLQFLDKSQKDPTAIPYEEKLEKFLSSVLVGDELAEKVRAAFDAYVFLSYRKKDRAYAKELMRLIHKNEFCRDIAIWYDEYLVPGENFNDSIRAAFEKSGLFVLAVTPNLVNETNYVMTVEYPMAREAEKPILPAELVPTDAALLKEKYEGIPESVSAADEAVFSEALLAHIKRLAITENDSSPEHNFFIGLAYLNGIDVEVDFARALSLIEGAAESGLAEAADRLVSMYRTGLGVARDYEKAIAWQRKKIAICKEKYEKSPEDAEVIREYWLSLFLCGVYLQESGRFEDAGVEYRKAEELLECNREKIEDATRKLLSASIWDMQGRAAYEKGHFVRAEEYYKKILELTVDAIEKNKLMSCYEMLGMISLSKNNLSEAKEYFEKCIEIIHDSAGEMNATEIQRLRYVFYGHFGRIALAEGDTIEAKKHFEKSLELVLNAAEKADTLLVQQDLLLLYFNLGGLALAKKKLAEAEGYLKKALNIAQNLMEKSGTAVVKHILCRNYEYLGIVAKERRRFIQANRYFKKSLELFLELSLKTDMVNIEQSLLAYYNVLGTKGLKISLSFAKKAGTKEAKRRLATGYKCLGDMAKTKGQLRKAENYYGEYLRISRRLASGHSVLEDYENLASAFACLSEVTKDAIEKERCLIEGIKIYDALAKVFPSEADYQYRYAFLCEQYKLIFHSACDNSLDKNRWYFKIAEIKK